MKSAKESDADAGVMREWERWLQNSCADCGYLFDRASLGEMGAGLLGGMPSHRAKMTCSANVILV